MTPDEDVRMRTASDIASVIGNLPVIGLEELNERAALLRRTDRKYVVTEEEFRAFIAQLADDVRVLEVEGRRMPAYESMYFDTADQASFRSTALRRRRRFKVRTRTYLDSQTSFIEVKVRDGRRRTVKVRVPCAFEGRHQLGATEADFVREVFRAHGLDAHIVDRLRPALTTTFHRVTLLVPSAGCRVTVDVDLAVAPADGQPLRVPGLVILETKSDASDQRVDRLLWRLGIRPKKVSKFAIGSVLADPSLPDNKWRRTIDRHFATATA